MRTFVEESDALQGVKLGAQLYAETCATMLCAVVALSLLLGALGVLVYYHVEAERAAERRRWRNDEAAERGLRGHRGEGQLI